MKVNGLTTKQKVLVFTPIIMEQFMKAIGSTINKMVREYSSGPMEAVIRVSSKQVKNMGMAPIFGPMAVTMPAIGKTTNYRAMENINGPTEGAIKENGSKIKCMDKECMCGRTAECTMEATLMIRNTAGENITGQMARCLKGSGSTANAKAEANTLTK